MANWKKMAEAFGRAMHSPKVTDAQFDRFARSAERSPETEIAFINGLDEGEDIGRRVSVDDSERDIDTKLERQFDAETDALTDKRLVDERQKEWDDAFRHAQGVMELPDDEMNGVLRSLIKDLKSRGLTEQDILNSLRSLGDK